MRSPFNHLACILTLSLCVLSQVDGTSTQRGRFLRESVNNIDALLTAVPGPLIAISVFTLEYREFAVNWHHSITHFGGVESVLLVAFDDASIHECLQLGFACFNASTLVSSSPGDMPSAVGYGSGEYNRLMWSKPLVLIEVLKRHRSALFSDLDTVWFKDAFRSYLHAADLHDADFVGMDDNNQLYPNAGNLFFRSNPRTIALVEKWLSIGLDLGSRRFTENASKFHDQDGLKLLNNTHWRACDSSASCLAVKAQGIAAVWLHIWHGCPGGQQPCDERYLYLHLFCTGGGVAHKKLMAVEKGMWWVDLDAAQPHMMGARATELVNATHLKRHAAHRLGDGSGERDPQTLLPCPNQVAWVPP